MSTPRKRAYSDTPGHIIIDVGGQETGLDVRCAKQVSEDLQEAILAALNSDWHDCRNVQCKQAHQTANAVLIMLGVECDNWTYIVGKCAAIALAINDLKKKAEAKK